ncbi:MAG: hypothetical protein GY836_10910 [Herbaspirillum sp.]|nr:hypothetical protein [Herbaspirillum sp.]
MTDRIDGPYRLAADRLGISLGAGARSSEGCAECSRSGYSGRTAVYELLDINEPLAQAIGSGRTEQELLSMAKENGFTTMAESAANLVNEGITSPVEVLRELSA